MELSLIVEYGWVLLVLIMLEGLLAADNALVLAILVRQLPKDKQKKALFYGLFGAFVFRFAALFTISFVVDVWQVQALGALYLLFIAVNHITRKTLVKRQKEETPVKEAKEAGFWTTVLKVELADIAFAVDSILAAVALAVTLPTTSLAPIGGMDGAHFLVVFVGGFIGLVLVRFAAQLFVALLERKPGLETAAYLIVGWVGVKLTVYTLSHPALSVISHGFAESPEWKVIFYAVLVLIAVGGWFLSKTREETPYAHPSRFQSSRGAADTNSRV